MGFTKLQLASGAYYQRRQDLALPALPPIGYAMQVDDHRPIHPRAYLEALVPTYRLAGPNVFLYWGGIIEDSRNPCELDALRAVGSIQAEFEVKLPPFLQGLQD